MNDSTHSHSVPDNAIMQRPMGRYDIARGKRRLGAFTSVWPGRVLKYFGVYDFGPFGPTGRYKIQDKTHKHTHTQHQLWLILFRFGTGDIYRSGGGWDCRWFARHE